MNDFKRTLVVATAATAFAVVTFTFATGGVSLLTSKVESILAARQSAEQAVLVNRTPDGM